MRRAEKPIPGAPKLPPEFFYRVTYGYLGHGVEVGIRRDRKFGSASVAESLGYYDHESEIADRLLFHAQMAYGKAVSRDLLHRAACALDSYIGDHRHEEETP
jgi:hypothetical protein